MFTKNTEFEIVANTEQRIFEGYASTWQKDLVGDQVLKGAFTKTISERFPLKKIRCLWQHREPLGIPLAMHEDEQGLYVKAKIANTTLGNDVLELMREGVISELSIGYDVIKDDFSQDRKTRFLKELKLYEFSAVTFGANPTTSINSVKSLAMLHELTHDRLFNLIKNNDITQYELEQAKKEIDLTLQKMNFEPSKIDTQNEQEKKALFDELQSIMKNLF